MEKVINLPLWYEAVEKNGYNIFLIYDKQLELINVLVNDKNRVDILDELLMKFCPDEIELYNHGELNIKLLDLIYNLI